MKRILVATVLAACVAGAPWTLWAAEQPAQKPAETQKASKAKTRPFRGTVKAFDKTAMTLTLEGEKEDTLCITSQTRIYKSGQPATTEAITVGEQVRGLARQNAEGKWEAVSLYLGQRPAPKGGQKKEGQPPAK